MIMKAQIPIVTHLSTKLRGVRIRREDAVNAMVKARFGEKVDLRDVLNVLLFRGTING